MNSMKNLISMVVSLFSSKNCIYYQAISEKCYDYLDDIGALDFGGIHSTYEIF